MLSKPALTVLEQLHQAGFEAYAVGGCVRDWLRHITPDDVDITTNALPEQILDTFRSYRVIPTGLQHGTVTVIVEGQPFEVTTFRTDGTYSDARRPDFVTFTTSLKDDLARRDFTVNAMAYHPKEGVIDPFGGKQDLENGILRCVGNPETRFTEDALRIARMARFMSVLNISCDQATADAAHRLCTRLDLVAAERKRVELMKMLMGDGFVDVALAFPDIVTRLVPALAPTVGFTQQNPHHSFDVYTHTVRAVHAARKDPLVRLAVLLHDIGKPSTFSTDENGIGHFYGHAAVSEQLAKDALQDLRFDNATIQEVLTLVKAHDTSIDNNRRQIKRYLSRFGVDMFERLLLVKEADARGCHEHSTPPDFSAVRATIADILAAEDCLTLRSLAVNGDDLQAIGIPKGPLLGKVLACLLEAVLNDTCQNEKDALLTLAKEYITHV